MSDVFSDMIDETPVQRMPEDSQLILGDSLIELTKFPDNSIDTMITDPPYGLSFMNKQWDFDVPFTGIWKQCYRVLKPGSFNFIMSGARQDIYTKMVSRLEEAGFDVAFDSIEWIYSTGFPKAQNIAKAIDARLLKDWVLSDPDRKAEYEKREKDNRVKLDTNVNKESASAIKYIKSFRRQWAKDVYGVELKETKYEHPGRKDRSYQTDSNVFSQDRKNDVVSRKSPFAGDHDGEWDNTQINNDLTVFEPVSPKAKETIGMYSNSLKPTREFVIVVQKPPVALTNIDQAIGYGNGGLMLDRCRIPADYEELVKNAKKGPATPGESGCYGWNSGSQHAKDVSEAQKALKRIYGGRLKNPITFGQVEQTGFKVRIPITRGEMYKGKESITGLTDPDYPAFTDVDIRGRFPANIIIMDDSIPGRDGEFSEKFSLDRWWFAQIDHLPANIRRSFPFLDAPKPSKNEKNKGLNTSKQKKINDGRETSVDVPFQRGETLRKNTHVSVKPIALMSYLIALSPVKPGSWVLDPFCGSGTTGIACKLSDMKYILIEKEKESFDIAEKRLKANTTRRSLLRWVTEL